MLKKINTLIIKNNFLKIFFYSFIFISKRIFFNKPFPKSLIFPYENIKKKIHNSEIKIYKEKILTKSKAICLKEDKSEELKPINTYFYNYLIKAKNENNFSLRNGYFFYNESYFYEKSRLYYQNNIKNLNEIRFFNYLDFFKFFSFINQYSFLNIAINPIKKKVNYIVNLSTYNNDSYYHWLLVPGLLALSSIKNIKKIIKKSYFYLSPSLKKKTPKYVLDVLRLLKINKNKIIYSNIRSKIIITTLQDYRKVGVSPKHLKFLRKIFLKKIKQEKNFEKIFISRSNASRNLTNEDEIFNYLERYHNFKKINLELLKFEDQVSIFNNAKIIIAPYGAGLANITFCKKGTKIITIFSSSLVRNEYYVIADALNLQYYYIVGSSSNYFKGDYSLSLDKLKRLLNTKSLQN